ncbi:transport permease protein [Clostridia bacterium]|nr:transport permease protein [Clostridia bacterium]
MLSLGRAVKKHGQMIWELSKSDFRKQFVGSYFGLAWKFIQPLVTILIYVLIFGVGFRSPAPYEGIPYVLWLVSGMIPWFFLSDSLNVGVGCLHEYHYLVKKVVFPIEVLPLIKLFSAYFVHVIFILIMLITFFLYQVVPSLYWLGILYYSFAASMFSLAIVYLSSAVYAFFRDIQQIISIILQFGMWLIPIMWNLDMFEGRSFYPVLQAVVKFNPSYYFMNGYRESMLLGKAFWERPLLALYFWGVVVVLFTVGYRLFMKMKPHFSDVL